MRGDNPLVLSAEKIVYKKRENNAYYRDDTELYYEGLRYSFTYKEKQLTCHPSMPEDPMSPVRWPTTI